MITEIILVSKLMTTPLMFLAISNMGANRYISEPHESDDSNTSTEAEAYPSDATFSEQNKSLPQDVRFARSWIDKGYTNELLDPKVCLRS